MTNTESTKNLENYVGKKKVEYWEK